MLLGDIARWEIPKATLTNTDLARYERLVRCGPSRVDEVTGDLVAQPPAACELIVH